MSTSSERAVDVDSIAGALMVSIGLLFRRLRHAPRAGDVTLPESAALARLDRGGPTSAAALARFEQISPQSMGATLGALEARGLVERRADPADGRRVIISISDAGLQMLRSARSARTEQVAAALSSGFTPSELLRLMEAAPLIERLAEHLGDPP